MARKQKAAYRFKAAKKSIATVSRKGVVTARKPGRTKITVFERINKKTRKIGKVTVLVTANKASKRGTVSPVNTAPAQTQPTAALPTIPSVPAITLPPSVSQTPSVSTDEPSKTPAASETPAPTTTVVYQNMFEDGDPRGFIARGSSSLEISNSENHSEGGKNSLLVNTRTATWHGTLMSLSSLTKTGETYDFEAWVKLGSAGTET